MFVRLAPLGSVCGRGKGLWKGSLVLHYGPGCGLLDGLDWERGVAEGQFRIYQLLFLLRSCLSTLAFTGRRLETVVVREDRCLVTRQSSLGSSLRRFSKQAIILVTVYNRVVSWGLGLGIRRVCVPPVFVVNLLSLRRLK